jgi:hypothetical protein
LFPPQEAQLGGNSAKASSGMNGANTEAPGLPDLSVDGCEILHKVKVIFVVFISHDFSQPDTPIVRKKSHDTMWCPTLGIAFTWCQ